MQAKTPAVGGREAALLEDDREMVSNMSSSERSSPMHSTKSGDFPMLCIVETRLSTTIPLLTPCK